MEKGHRRSDPKMHAPKHENSQKEHDSLQISSPSKLKRIISLQVGGRDGSLTLIIPARLGPKAAFLRGVLRGFLAGAPELAAQNRTRISAIVLWL
jgi:hypothetical protein